MYVSMYCIVIFYATSVIISCIKMGNIDWRKYNIYWKTNIYICRQSFISYIFYTNIYSELCLLLFF